MTNNFVYTTYIRATPDQVWVALTTPEFTREYWREELRSDWWEGSSWKAVGTDSGRIGIVGEVVESVPPTRLVLTWASSAEASDRSNYSRVTFAIEIVADMVRLVVTHDRLKSETAELISAGWPRVLASLKSFLETGKALDTWAGVTRSCDSAAQQTAA